MKAPLKIYPTAGITEDLFFDLCQVNADLPLERDAEGCLIVREPAGTETGFYNSDINGQVWLWNRQTGAGYVFDSSTGFTLPDSSVRSPDVSWVAKSRWEALNEEERSRFAPLCPDLVVEIRSVHDKLSDLQVKMESYQDNGARLGWLIDRRNKRVYIYREDGSLEIKKGECLVVNGEDVLPGLYVDMGF